MSDEFESSDATPETTDSGSENQASSAPDQGDGQQDAAPSQSQDANVPFHEHPRFKELIEQNRAFKSEIAQAREATQRLNQQYEAQAQELAKYSKPQGPTHQQLLDRLRQIDPEFGQFQSQIAEKLNGVDSLQKEINEFKQWREQVASEQTRNQAESKLTSLYGQYKVPQELQGFYRQSIENMAYNNRNATVADLDAYFKQTHEGITKFLNDRDRKLRESYVTEKKKDQTPASTSGGVPAGGKKPGPMTFDDQVKYVAQEMRRAKQKI